MTDASGEPAPIAGKVDGYPCPECGAQTALRPGTDSLVCDHCGARIPIETADRPVVEHDFAAAVAGKGRRPADQMAEGGREVQCTVCGARAVVTRQATRCAFCDAPMVVELPAGEDTILPESLLPFAIEQRDAAARFGAWLKSRWFAPGDLVRRAKRDGMDGVYIPYWTFDSDTTTRYVGQRGEHYWETEHYTDGSGQPQTRRVQKTRWWPAGGVVRLSFDDVLVCATPSLPRKIIDKLEPWDLPELRPFDGKFLAGFIAERYQVELGDGFKVAQQRMAPKIRAAVRRDIGGDEQRIIGMDVRHDDVTFKHVLLPLWLSSFRYQDKVYRVTVNARSGEIAGQRPWSWIKIALLIVVIAAAIATIVYLIDRSRKPHAERGSTRLVDDAALVVAPAEATAWSGDAPAPIALRGAGWA